MPINLLTGYFMLFCYLIFFKITFLKNHFMNTITVSSRFVEPDLIPNYLQRISEDDTSRQRFQL